MTIRTRSMAVDAVLFDMDGTLVDTAPEITEAVNLTLRDLALAPLDLEQVTCMIGRGSPVLIERVLEAAGARVSHAVRRRALVSYEAHYTQLLGSRTRLYPHVARALGELRRMDMKLGVVTNKSQRMAFALLQRFGLSDVFDLVVGGDTLQARKPSPLPLLHACQALGTAPAQTLYVGDSINDVEAATAAGMRVICVPYGYNEGKPVSSLAATAFIDTFAELPALIATNAGRAKGFHSFTSQTGERA
jgi:phosphoglycolate phosphatase